MNVDKKYRWGGAAVALTVGIGIGYGYQNFAIAQSANPVPRSLAPKNAPVAETPAVKDAAAMQTAFAQVAKTVEPAVVTITARERAVRPIRREMPFRGQPGLPGSAPDLNELFRQFQRSNPQLEPNSASPEQQLSQDMFRPIQEGRGGLGSGFLYDNSGLILTNAHVVGGAKTVDVTLADGREFKGAKVLGSDALADIAVVKINGQNLPTVSLGDSGNVNVGDWAIAVGNPFGLSNTMTVGIISAKAREVGLNRRSPGDYLQTDASINPGNSGGPLVNIFGQVVGVNNAIYSPSGGNVGIGFAIPINTARTVADQLAKTGRVRRAQLGISISEVGDNASAFGLPTGTKGVLVAGVEPNSAAAKAGLLEGDVITALNGEAVSKPADLQRKVNLAPVGQRTMLTVLRNGKTVTLTALLDEVKSENNDIADSADNVTPDTGEPAPAGIGIRVAPLNGETSRQVGVNPNLRGVLITGVAQDSPAENAGLRAGDVVTRVAQTPVATPEEFRSVLKKILDSQSSDKKVALYVKRRGGDSGYVLVTMNQ
jgi:serine protease Do